MTTRTVAHLRKEHEQSARLLAALRRSLHELEALQIADSREASPLIELLAEIVLPKQEEKKEGILLPEMARQGLSWSDGILADVRREHRQSRYFVRCLRHAMRQRQAWSKEDRAHYLSLAHAWIDFLRDQMHREEQLIFPYVDSHFDLATDVRMVVQFDALDREFATLKDAPALQDAGETFARRYVAAEREGGQNSHSYAEVELH